MQESASFFQVIFNLFLWICIYVTLKRAYKYPYTVSKKHKRIGMILILLFCLYPFWGGDYFHYKEIFNNFVRGGDLSGQEEIYNWLFTTFGFSYTILRLAIWGVALLALFWAYRRANKKSDLTIFLFGICFLPTFSYARASLSMSLILLGLTFIVYPGKISRLLSLILGVCIMLCAALFHKSAPIGIAMAIMSIFLIDSTQKKLAFIVLLIPLLVLALQNALNYFSLMELDADTYITDRARSTYFEVDDGDSGRTGIGALLGSFLLQGPSYLIALLYITVAWSGKTSAFTITERVISAYAFCVTLLSIGFSLDLGYSLRVLQYRTLFFAFPANAVFLSAVHRYGIKKKFFKTILYVTILGTGYQLLYASYIALVLH